MRSTEMPLEPEFLNQFPIVRFNKDDILFRCGEELTHLYYLTSGVCASRIVQSNGNYIIPCFYRSRELIGVRNELFGERNIARGTCIAKTAVYAYKIPANVFRKYMNENFEVYKNATKSVLSSEKEMLSLSQMRVHGNSAAMVCTFLISLMEKSRKDGMYYVDKAFTVSDIADSLQLHRVTVSRIMTRLQELGIIEKVSQYWKITGSDELARYAEGEKIMSDLYPKK